MIKLSDEKGKYTGNLKMRNGAEIFEDLRLEKWNRKLKILKTM